VVVLTGDLDSTNSADMLARLNAAVETAADVQVDLAGVRFINSAAASAILVARRTAAARGQRLWVGEMSENVRQALEVMCLVSLLTSR
jgi:anti-anti-sigma factor